MPEINENFLLVFRPPETANSRAPVGAKTIARGRGDHKIGNSWRSPCPANVEVTPQGRRFYVTQHYLAVTKGCRHG